MNHKHSWQDEFILDSGLIYLNHAAVAPWPQRTRDAVSAFAEENARRGSQGYPRWLQVERQLRQLLATLINAPAADDIALLKNTSEALSVVAYGLDWQAGDNIVISNEEFPSNRIVWQSLSQYGVEVREVDLAYGESPEAALLDACDNNTHLLSISAVQYASGLRMDLQRLGEACRSKNILFCIDAIQHIGALQFDVQAIHADFVMADGHKWMLGPEGLALFYVRPELRERLQLKQFGWHMVEQHHDFNKRQWTPAHSARRFECGSPNMLAIHALHASIQLILQTGMQHIEERVLANSRLMIDTIQQTDNLELLTNQDAARLSGIVTFRNTGKDSQQLYQTLMDNDVMCAARGGGVRFSPHFYNNDQEIEQALQMAAS